MTVARFDERTLPADDGLTLYYREYGAARAGLTSLLCLPALTRNCKDFHDLAVRQSSRRRVLCPDLRGRGRSGHDPDWNNYRVPVYISDLRLLLAAAGVDRVVIIGTSLGGIIAMVLAAQCPDLLAGVVLNDIGPDMRATGLGQIATLLERRPEFTDWREVAAMIKRYAAPAYPGLDDAAWMAMAKRGYRRWADGIIRPDHDPDIARTYRRGRDEQGQLWPFFEALGPIPTLLLRGRLSNLVSAATAARMKQVKPDLEVVTVPGRGHVPLLDEPPCVEALDRFLGSL